MRNKLLILLGVAVVALGVSSVLVPKAEKTPVVSHAVVIKERHLMATANYPIYSLVKSLVGEDVDVVYLGDESIPEYDLDIPSYYLSTFKYVLTVPSVDTWATDKCVKFLTDVPSHTLNKERVKYSSRDVDPVTWLTPEAGLTLLEEVAEFLLVNDIVPKDSIADKYTVLANRLNYLTKCYSLANFGKVTYSGNCTVSQLLDYLHIDYEADSYYDAHVRTDENVFSKAMLSWCEKSYVVQLYEIAEECLACGS